MTKSLYTLDAIPDIVLWHKVRRLVNLFLLVEATADHRPFLMQQFPMVANYRCAHSAASLADFLLMMDPDLKVELRELTGLDTALNNAGAHPQTRGPHIWHAVTRVNEWLYIDLTFRQFDLNSPFPLYMTDSLLNKIWEFNDPYKEGYVPQAWPAMVMSAGDANLLVRKYEVKAQTLISKGLCYEGYEAWHTQRLPKSYKATLALRLSNDDAIRLNNATSIALQTTLNNLRTEVNTTRAYISQLHREIHEKTLRLTRKSPPRKV